MIEVGASQRDVTESCHTKVPFIFMVFQQTGDFAAAIQEFAS